MSGPWEDYKPASVTAEKGPWDDYAQAPDEHPLSGVTPDIRMKAMNPDYKPDAPEWAGQHPNLYAAANAARDVLGTPLEVGAMVGGGIIGAGASLNPVTAPITGVAGAGIGYAGAKRVLKGVDVALGREEPEASLPEALKQTGKDVVSGAAMEGGGQVAGKVLEATIPPVLQAVGWTWKKVGLPSLTRRGIEKEAGEILVKNTSEGPVFARNAAEAAAIEKEIGSGLKYTRGQKTGDPLAIMQERSLSSGGVATTKNLEQQATGNKAIHEFYARSFPEGAGANDAIRTVERNKLGIQEAESLAKKNLEGIKTTLGKGVDIQKSGDTIFDTLKSAKEAARETKNKLYADIPNVPVTGSDKLTKEIQRISKPYGAFENSKQNVPQVFQDIDDILRGQGDANIGFQDLQSLKARLNNDIRMERSAQSPNDYKVKRLAEFKEFVVKEMRKLGNSKKYGEVAEQFKQAEKFYAEKYIPFKQGKVGEVLRPGMRGEESRVASAEVASRFWKPDAADDFLRVIGDNAKAKQAMKDYAAHDLLKSATHAETGELIPQKVFNWYAKNTPMLKKYGLTGDFNGPVKAAKTVNAWKAQAEAFDKSVAAKLLDADPEQAIAAAFSGNTKNSIGTVRELMNAVKGNKAGEDGLRKAMAEHLMKQVETTAKDQLGEVVVSTAKLTKLMRQYEPALQVLYKDTPEKLNALKTINKAYEILGRTQKPIGSGSDTVEKAVGLWRLVKDRAVKLPVLRGIDEAFRGVNEKYRNEFLTRAAFDPEYAQTLIMSSKGMVSKEVIRERISQQLSVLGYTGGRSMERPRGDRVGQSMGGVP